MPRRSPCDWASHPALLNRLARSVPSKKETLATALSKATSAFTVTPRRARIDSASGIIHQRFRSRPLPNRGRISSVARAFSGKLRYRPGLASTNPTVATITVVRRGQVLQATSTPRAAGIARKCIGEFR